MNFRFNRKLLSSIYDNISSCRQLWLIWKLTCTPSLVMQSTLRPTIDIFEIDFNLFRFWMCFFVTTKCSLFNPLQIKCSALQYLWILWAPTTEVTTRVTHSHRFWPAVPLCLAGLSLDTGKKRYQWWYGNRSPTLPYFRRYLTMQT